MGKKIKGFSGIALMAVFLSLSACAPWLLKENREEEKEASIPASGISEAASEEMSEEDSALEEEEISFYDDSYKAHHSMFAWDLYFLNEGAFPEFSNTLSHYGTDRIYQEIPVEYFKEESLYQMVKNCRASGMEVVALEGDRDWQEEGLQEFYNWMDGILYYNAEHPDEAIKEIALDVESYTLKSFKENPTEGFKEYIEVMEEAYSYASVHGIKVVQVIPESLNEIDEALFKEFLLKCCDEVSIMNYEKKHAIENIEKEVLICREYGIPVETIFETMPLNDYYSVTEEKTYFYEGSDALMNAVGEMEDYYGCSLGIGFHYFRTIYYLDTGRCILELYPYSKKKDSETNEYGQAELGKELVLSDGFGEMLPAWPYNPNLHNKAKEYCYLVPGILPDRDYAVLMDSSKYHSATEKIRLEGEEGKVGYTASFKVRPN